MSSRRQSAAIAAIPGAIMAVVSCFPAAYSVFSYPVYWFKPAVFLLAMPGLFAENLLGTGIVGVVVRVLVNLAVTALIAYVLLRAINYGKRT